MTGSSVIAEFHPLPEHVTTKTKESSETPLPMIHHHKATTIPINDYPEGFLPSLLLLIALTVVIIVLLVHKKRIPRMKLLTAASLLPGALLVQELTAFAGMTLPSTSRTLMTGALSSSSPWFARQRHVVVHLAVAENDEESLSSKEAPEDTTIEFSSDEEKKEAVGNLVADDEWLGLSMELSELVRIAVIEDFKQNARDFLGKDEYKVGDISKEIDTRVKNEVASMRGKESYELGDFVTAMDEMAKNMTENLTGKPYEAGDLSIELDKRIKKAVAGFCGKDEYKFGDLSREISTRVQTRVEEFSGKPYEFGDITREVESRRKEWVQNFLGEEAAANYQFGDITKKFVTSWTGKKDYQFGDISKKLMGDLFGARKRKQSD